MNNMYIITQALSYLCLVGGDLYDQKEHQPVLEEVEIMALPRKQQKLLVAGYCRRYNIRLPLEIFSSVGSFLYGNLLQYKNQPLPADLSGKDLRGFDFTDCEFNGVRLGNAQLDGAILLRTKCHYQGIFRHNIKKSKCDLSSWYQDMLFNDLESIAQVYPKLLNNVQKGKLLQVASGIAYLPWYQKQGERPFKIQLHYWYCVLLMLKKEIGKELSKELTCSLEADLEDDFAIDCWQTRYPKEQINIDSKKLPHTKIPQYLKEFHKGLKTYRCQSEDRQGFFWYKTSIENSMKGLQVVYRQIKRKRTQLAICRIAFALSKSYQLGHAAFLLHYLFYQKKIMELKESMPVKIKGKLYYNTALIC